MNLAEEIARLRGKGFSEDRAEIIVLMREAAVVLFRAFPDSFLLFGGANLIFFHNSLRHSADLDLLSITPDMPEIDDIRNTLVEGLKPLIQLLKIEDLKIQIIRSEDAMKKISIGADGRTLFTVDLTRMGSVLEKEVEEHPTESVSSDLIGMIKAVSRDLLLLQKAEAFLMRKIIKVRDAYDIKLLMSLGATLGSNLKQHLEDDLRWNEIESEQIIERINQVDIRHCEAELGNVLPTAEFKDLRDENFEPLRDSLLKLFADWV